MAKVTDVTDVPDLPGAGLLHFDDGRPPLMAMPEIASDYRAKLGIDPIANGVAGPGSGTPDAGGAELGRATTKAMDAAGKWLTTPIELGADSKYRRPAPSGPGGPVDPVSGRPLPPGVTIGTPEQFPPTPTPPPVAPAPGPAEGPSDAAAPGEPPPPLLDADLSAAADAALRGHTETTGERTTRSEATRGAPYSKADADQRIAAGQAVRDTAVASMRAEQAGLNAQAAAAEARVPYLQLQKARAETELDEKQTAYRQRRAGLEKELTDFDKSATIDPLRFYSGPNAVSAMMSIIGAGIGAAGASLAHTQNWAFDHLQQRIKDDVQAQRDQIQAGHAGKANALSRFVDYYQGDLTQAQTALEIAMKRAALSETERFASQSKSREISANIPGFIAKFNDSLLKDEQTLQRQAIGSTKSETTSKTESKSSSTTPEEILKIQEARQGGKRGAVSPDKTADIQLKYGEARAKHDEVWQTLQEQADAMGLKIDRKRGLVLGKDNKPVDPTKPDLPGLGVLASHAPGWWVGPDGRNLRRLIKRQVDAYRKESTGVAYSPEELESATDQFIGFNNEDTVRNFQRAVAEAEQKDRSLEAAFPQQAVRTRESRGTETNVEHAKSKAPKVTPYE